MEHEFRWTRHQFKPLLATRYISLGGWVHLRTYHSDPQAGDVSCWPAVVPLLITRCLYLGWGIRGSCRGSWGVRGIGGYIWNIKMGYYKVLLKTEDGLLQAIIATTKRSIYINCSIFNKSYLDWSFYFHCCCCYCVILLLLLFICNDRWMTTLHSNNNNNNNNNKRSIYINCSIFNN